jgi:hypothetical protein
MEPSLCIAQIGNNKISYLKFNCVTPKMIYVLTQSEDGGAMLINQKDFLAKEFL